MYLELFSPHISRRSRSPWHSRGILLPGQAGSPRWRRWLRTLQPCGWRVGKYIFTCNSNIFNIFYRQHIFAPPAVSKELVSSAGDDTSSVNINHSSAGKLGGFVMMLSEILNCLGQDWKSWKQIWTLYITLAPSAFLAGGQKLWLPHYCRQLVAPRFPPSRGWDESQFWQMDLWQFMIVKLLF